MPLPSVGCDLSLGNAPNQFDVSFLPADIRTLCTPPAGFLTYNVLSYGAFGDGIHDDTPAIRSALAAAGAAGGGYVYLPAGTYAVCRQPGEVPGTVVPIFNVSGFNNVVVYGDGAGRTVLKGYMPGLLDPVLNWAVVGSTVSRFCMFFMQQGSQNPRANFHLRSLTVDGQCPYTGNSTVNGVPATGDGWDLTHKALRTSGAITGIVVQNVETKDWRGEHLYGGQVSGTFTAANSKVTGSNASAVSVTADFKGDHLQVGGPGAGDDVYNGFENFATLAGSTNTWIRNCLVQGGSAANAAHGNGAALLGVPGTAAVVTDNAFTKCGKAVLLSEVVDQFSFLRNTLQSCSGGVITSILGLYAQTSFSQTGFTNLLLDANASDAGGVFLNMQSHHGPSQPLTVSNNTLTTSGQLAAGNWGSVLPSTFAFTNNNIGSGCKDYSGTWVGVRGLWSGTTRPPGTGSYNNAANDYGAASLRTTVAAVSDGVVLNDTRSPAGVPHYAEIDPATLALYPEGYAVTFLRGPSARNLVSQPWTVPADPAWNTLSADLPVPAGGVTLVFTAGKFAVQGEPPPTPPPPAAGAGVFAGRTFASRSFAAATFAAGVRPGGGVFDGLTFRPRTFAARTFAGGRARPPAPRPRPRAPWGGESRPAAPWAEA